MTTILRGTEADTLEIRGVLSEGARPEIPAPLVLAGDRIEVDVLFFAMHGLALRGLPRPAFDYTEALWRVGVESEGKPAWLAVACDIDRALIRALGRRIVRYPTRVASFGERWSVETSAGKLAVHVDEGSESPAAVPARRTFVRDRGRLYEIPWEEIAAPERHIASVVVTTDSLSELTFGTKVTWAKSALVHRGRTHMCGIAKRI